MKNIKINTNLEMVEYIVLINNMADAFFDDKGNYQPHIGVINAMRVFYNVCVISSDFDDEYPHNIEDLLDMSDIVVDKDFCEAFLKSINEAEFFDFGNAYSQVLDIVNSKKNNIGNLGEKIIKYAEKIVESINETMTEDNLEILDKIISKSKDGGLNEKAIVDAYIESERLKEITKKKDKNEFEEIKQESGD